MSVKASIETLAQVRQDTGAFARAAFERVFFTPMNVFHRRIADAIDAEDALGHPLNKQVVFNGPRGLGKTSLVLTGYAGKKIVHRKVRYVAYMTASGEKAIEKTENLKNALLQSDFILDNYGSIIPEKDDSGVDFQFSKETYIVKLAENDPLARKDYPGTKVLPLGANQLIVGSVFGEARPDLIMGDDYDDPRYLKNPALRQAAKEDWMQNVMPSISRYDHNHQIIYWGTRHHPDCLLATLMKSESWVTVDLSVCDKEFKTLCPEYMDQPTLDALIREHQEMGMMGVFYREYMNQDGDAESAPFKEEYFHAYDETTTEFLAMHLDTIILVDPANTTNLKSCNSAIVGVGINWQTGAVYVRDWIEDKLHPDELHQAIIDMGRALNACAVAVEDNGLKEYFTFPLENRMAMEGWGKPLIRLIPRKAQLNTTLSGKDDRICSTVPLYRKGLIFHNRANRQHLEMRLTNFRPGVGASVTGAKDLIDALGYVTQVMAERERFFAGHKYANEKERATANRKSLEELRNRKSPIKIRHRESARPAWTN